MPIARVAAEPIPKPAAAKPPAATADLDFIIASYLLMVVGAFAGWGLWHAAGTPSFVALAGVSTFAPLYVFAQSIERLLEPFATFFGGADATHVEPGATGVKKPEAVLMRAEAIVDQDPDRAADWAGVVDKIRHNTAVLTWAIASVLGMLASGGFGILLLHRIGFTSMRPSFDIAITGLAIGSGTKPLHDLISNLQKAKEQREDPRETGGAL